MKNNWLGILLSGLLLGASFPPSPLPWISWIAWIPLLIVLYRLPEKAEEDSLGYWLRIPLVFLWRTITFQYFYRASSRQLPLKREISKTHQAFRYLFVCFFLWNIITCYWLMLTALSVSTDEAFTSFLAGFVASLINPLMMCVPILIWTKFQNRLNAGLSAVFFIACWMSFEYLHFHWDLSWSWITLGNAFTAAPIFIQYAEFTGVLGISLWILIINILFYYSWNNRHSIAKAGIYCLTGLVLGFLPLLLNIWILNPARDVFQRSGTLNARIVQPNIDPYYKFDTDGLDQQLNTFYRLADKPGADTIDLVVFPETAIPEAVWTQDLASSEPLKGFWTLVSRYPRMGILTGLTELRFFAQGPLPPTARPTEGGHYDYCNSAVLIGSSNMRTYQKAWLVPMVERVPFLDQLSFLKDYNIDIGGGFGSYGKSDSAFNLYTRQDVPIGVMICYESAFPDHAIGYTQQGAQVLSVITNDGWWKQSSGYIQHAGLSVLRAIENRREIIRSANTGTSLFVDVYGNRYQDTPWWQEAVIDRKVNLYTDKTFFVRNGPYLGKIAFVLLIVLLIYSLFASGTRQSGTE